MLPRVVLRGHEDTVEDVQFHPTDPDQLCSVGDDSCLMLWDARQGEGPCGKVRGESYSRETLITWGVHIIRHTCYKAYIL